MIDYKGWASQENREAVNPPVVAATTPVIQKSPEIPPNQGYYTGGVDGAWYGPGSPPPSIDQLRTQGEQAKYTAKHAMSRDDFLKKYGKTFVADDKGGIAASEVAGKDVGEYYDKYLGPNAGKTVGTGFKGTDGYSETPIAWGEGRYQDAHPYFDGYDNVNPHPESQKGNGWDEAWKQIRPFAAMAAMAYGGWALAEGAAASGAAATAGGTGVGGAAGIGSGTVLGGGAATGQGLIGSMLSSPLAAPIISGGTTLARGGNIGDALKNAGLAYVGGQIAGGASGWAQEALGTGATVSNAIGSTVGAIATGRDPLKALVSSGVNAATGMITAEVPGFDALSPIQKTAVNTIVSSTLKGKNPTAALINQATNFAINEVAKQSKI